jgi:hypothetical protein
VAGQKCKRRAVGRRVFKVSHAPATRLSSSDVITTLPLSNAQVHFEHKCSIRVSERLKTVSS